VCQIHQSGGTRQDNNRRTHIVRTHSGSARLTCCCAPARAGGNVKSVWRVAELEGIFTRMRQRADQDEARAIPVNCGVQRRHGASRDAGLLACRCTAVEHKTGGGGMNDCGVGACEPSSLWFAVVFESINYQDHHTEQWEARPAGKYPTQAHRGSCNPSDQRGGARFTHRMCASQRIAVARSVINF